MFTSVQSRLWVCGCLLYKSLNFFENFHNILEGKLCNKVILGKCDFKKYTIMAIRNISNLEINLTNDLYDLYVKKQQTFLNLKEELNKWRYVSCSIHSSCL